MKVQQFKNKLLSSNSYILYFEKNNCVWVIDPGDSGPLIDWIKSKNKTLKGILLTHSHADHTYGINDLIKHFPKAKKYSSFLSVEAFKSEKLNGSLYMEIPFTIDSEDFTFVSDIISAVIAAAESSLISEIINIGSDNTYSINKLTDLLEGEVVYIPKRPGEPDCTWADISKAKTLLSWEPKVSLEEGVKILLDNISYWEEAPVWDEKSIAVATKKWFEFLG